jgi:peptidoglycan/xylan/chitin deacetylase (PgdA/CDA1 family)
MAVTFDDAYAGAVRLALPFLAERGIPATVFVAPGRLGNTGMWWDTLGTSGGQALDAGEREAALIEARGVDEEVRVLGGSRGWPSKRVASDAGIASIEELRRALQIPGLTVGSHTWSHPNLTRSTDSELEVELDRSYQWIAAEAGPAFRPWIAYPYGLSNPRVELAARSAGFTSGFLVAGGWTTVPPAQPLRVSRLNVPAGISADGMRLRGAGVFCR